MAEHPFQISGEDVEAMKRGFGAFVRRLLEAEGAIQRLPGDRVLVSTREDDPDGGIDATIIGSLGSRWVPTGDSTWQFKRSDVSPGQIRTELEKKAVKEAIDEGSAYCLAVGQDLTPLKTRRRQRSLRKTIANPDRIRFYQASHLAAWANDYPAVLATLGKFGPFITHDEWSERRDHVTEWVGDDARNARIEQIRDQLRASTNTIRIEGTSGIGKTRLALEALRSEDLAPLVAYAVAESDVDADFLNSMIRKDHDVIVVVDECPPEAHRVFEKRLQAEGRLRLVTIGPSGELGSIRTGVLRLEPISPEALATILEVNFRALSEQRRRYVSDVSGGVPGLAVQIATALTPLDEADAAELMRRTDVAAIVDFLAGDLPLELVRSVALFRRIGYEGEKASQIAVLAAWLGTEPRQIREILEKLEARGFIQRQGRYRMVTPFPVAVSLAAQAWERESDRILGELLPALDHEAATALLGRAADLGRFQPAAAALETLLTPAGPFGSVEALEQQAQHEMLTYLSVVAPQRAAAHLNAVVTRAEIETLLGAVNSRRSLVWSLEKLAWHPETFETSADTLLRLAVAENETWSNNSTGVWMDLFGARLPSTAASPDQRLEYLTRQSQSDLLEVRNLVSDAAARGVQLSETRSVSAELQEGAAVGEPGRTRDRDEDQQYREGMLSILADLASDRDPSVASSASNHLVALGLQLAGTHLWHGYTRAINRMPGAQTSRLRREAQRWLRIIEESDRRSGEPQVRELIEALRVDDPLEQLKDVGATPQWSLNRDEIANNAHTLLLRLVESDRMEEVWVWLDAESVSAAYFIGRALSRLPGATGDSFKDRVVGLARLNPAALAGYVEQAEEDGHLHRDEFLDSERGMGLPAEWRARLSMSPEPSDRSLDRIEDLIAKGQLGPLFSSVLGLGGWTRNYPPNRLGRILQHWIDRAETAEETAAVTDLLGLHLHREDSVPDELIPISWDILERRLIHPKLGTAEWDWAQIAKHLVESDPVRMAGLMLRLMIAGMMILASDPEAEVLSTAAELDPGSVWDLLTTQMEAEGGFVIAIEIRGWLLTHFPLRIITEWVGDSTERAEVVASLAPVGRADPGPLARWLLMNFTGNEAVRASLRSGFYEGGWTGPMSAWIGDMIEALEGWTDEPVEVRAWSAEFVGYLRADQRDAIEREEERGF